LGGCTKEQVIEMTGLSPRLVPEQALQGQVALDTDEADTAATRQGPASAFLCLLVSQPKM